MSHRIGSGVCVVLVMAALGCRDHRTPAERAAGIEGEIVAAAGQVQGAAEKMDAKAAWKSADRAGGLLVELEGLVGGNPSASTPERMERARRAVHEAKELAAVTQERSRRAEICQGIKARTYRFSEALAYKGFCEASALACDQAARNPGAMPERLRNTAAFAADLDEALTGRAPLPDGTPDYAAIGAALRASSTAAPGELHLALAASHLFAGHEDLALIEVEQVNAGALGHEDVRLVCHVLKIAIYRLHRFDHLALEETRAASAAGRDVSWFTPEIQSGLHLCLAASYLQEKQVAAADLEIARASQLYPNNPVTVFLTGERLAADGKREQAAESLEKAAAGSPHEWFATALAQRARQMRDASTPAGPVLLDGAFLRLVALHYLKEHGTQAAHSLAATVADLPARIQAALSPATGTAPVGTAPKP